MDGGENPVALGQQAVEHQQGQGGLCRVGVYDDVTESSEVLVTQKRRLINYYNTWLIQHGQHRVHKQAIISPHLHLCFETNSGINRLCMLAQCL